MAASRSWKKWEIREGTWIPSGRLVVKRDGVVLVDAIGPMRAAPCYAMGGGHVGRRISILVLPVGGDRVEVLLAGGVAVSLEVGRDAPLSAPPSFEYELFEEEPVV